MRHNLERSLALIFHHEAGYVNHPSDPGGPTNHGVTIATLSAFLGRSATIADVKALTKDKALEILKRGYADKVSFDQLPTGLDHAVLDFAVNSGPSRAAKELQRIVGTAPDGIIGMKTIAACKAYPAGIQSLINTYIEARMDFLRKLKTWNKFGRGWTRRVLGIDPKGHMKKQLGVIGESIAMLKGMVPQGIDPAGNIAVAKARDSDINPIKTTRGKLTAGGIAGAVIATASEIGTTLAPYSETFELIKWAALIVTIVATIAGCIVVIDKMKEGGAEA